VSRIDPHKFEANCSATMIGSLPYTDPQQACSTVLRYLPEIPVWPQLPRRSYLENMYVQFSQGFPGVVVDEEAQRIYVKRSQDLSQPLEKLYKAYLEKDLNTFAIGTEYAAGLPAFLSLKLDSPLAVKGQITGPVSWALTVADEERRPIFYDEMLSDALARLLRLRAAWQERKLRVLCPSTIIFVDEPSMSAFGSAYVAISRERVIKLLDEVFGGLEGLKGVHCCGNTDWPVLLATSADIVSPDVYNYIASMSLYPVEVKTFLDRGGIIAWGIVPDEEISLKSETVPSLRERLEEAMSPLSHKGIPFHRLIHRSLVTPSCGLTGLSVEAAERALELLAELSCDLKKRYLKD
jgi:methionine synthase II (cobalamin-independent)